MRVGQDYNSGLALFTGDASFRAEINLPSSCSDFHPGCTCTVCNADFPVYGKVKFAGTYLPSNAFINLYCFGCEERRKSKAWLKFVNK